MFNDNDVLNREAIAAEYRLNEYNLSQTNLHNATNPHDDQNYRVEQDTKSDLLRWQQDLDNELFDLVMSLKGYRLSGSDYVQVRDHPICNDMFIYDVLIPQLKPFFSKVMANTNLKQDEINRMLRYTCDEIADNMADNFYLYDIDGSNMTPITRTIKNNLKSSANRAVNGWTKKTDSSQYKVVQSQTSVERPQQERRGVLGLFNT